MRRRVLGADFEFESASPALLRLVDAAYGGLPAHRLRGRSVPRFRIRLQLAADTPGIAKEPPTPRIHGGAGLLTVTLDAGNFAVVDPAARAGLVVISSAALKRWPRLVRYELLEFAVFTLAHRGQRLVSLHAGCIGAYGRGLLLIGDAGAGKTTLALLAACAGLDFLTEDAAFVDPATLRATGVPNFLHVRADALRHVAERKIAARIRRSPVIRRRSGVEKYEVDLRRMGASPARAPLELAGIVFLAGGLPADDASRAIPELVPLGAAAVRRRLIATQAYAASQPGWAEFVQGMARLPAFELRRGGSPADSLAVLQVLLGVRSGTARR